MNRGLGGIHTKGALLEAGATIPVLKSGQVSETFVNVAPIGGVVTINLSLGTVFNLSLTQPVSSFVIVNANPAKMNVFTLVSTQDSIGSRTIAFTFANKTVKWSGGTAPTPTATALKADVFSFISSDGGNTFFGFTGGQNF